MSGLRNTYRVHVYKIPVDFDPSGTSEWVFSAEVTGDDDDAIDAMTTRTHIEPLDPEEIKAARKDGRLEALIAGAVKTETVMSRDKARLLRKTRSWSGPFFEWDETDCDDPAFATYSPVVGGAIPVNEETIGALPTEIRNEAISELRTIWAGRSQPEQENFSGERADSAGPAKKRRAN